MSIKAVAVFCGSRSGTNSLFALHARQLGTMLAHRGITLIYGGGSKGIMAEIANAVLENNGRVVGIIPKLLNELESRHNAISEILEVPDMHTRKRMLYEKCDAAVILPGGYGTLDEFFEILTWNQLNIHDKKIIIMNSAGFYDHLIKHLQTMEEQQFLYHKILDKLSIVNEPGEIIF